MAKHKEYLTNALNIYFRTTEIADPDDAVRAAVNFLRDDKADLRNTYFWLRGL